VKAQDMKSTRLLISTLIFTTVFQFAFAQIGIGQWRDHIPYRSGLYVAESNSDIYVSTGQGLFYYDKLTGETDRLTKVNGLSDVGIKSIAYSDDYDVLVIGYYNGNLDLLKDNEIVNVSDIKRKTIIAEKSINSIDFIDQYAVLSTGFGIVLFDIDRDEIKSTWYIGNLGSYIKIYETTFDGQYVIAATEKGIYKGDYLNSNLADFSNWNVITDFSPSSVSLDLPGKCYNALELFAGKLIVSKHSEEFQNMDTLYVFENDTWSDFPDATIHQCSHLVSNEDKLVLTQEYKVLAYDSDLEVVSDVYVYGIAGSGESLGVYSAMAIPGKVDEMVIADRESGLIRHKRAWVDSKVSLNGPFTYKVFDISSAGGKVWTVAGGVDLSWGPTWTRAEVNVFEDNVWSSFQHNNDTVIANMQDMNIIMANPYNPTQVFAGSWIYGLIEFDNDKIINHYTPENSTLEKVPGNEYIRIGGLAFDKDQNLWVTNSGASTPVHVRTPDNKWVGLDYSSSIGSFNISKIIVTSNDDKWVILPQGGGLFAFDDNDTPEDINDDRTKKFSVKDEYGEVISNEIYDIVEDKDGSIWVGTNVGVVVYYDPEDVFDEDIYGHQILIPRDDGTNNADILLGSEIVTDIAVDGANKKWFATQGGGVFQTSEDGIELIHSFNEDNSPLFSNTVYCLEINPDNGEVFFGTTQGILSYRGEATEGSDDYVDVYTFPNPVEHDYDGPITVHGLVAGSIVKITDISGNLVYETRSEGGQAIWYGKNLNGERVYTGVYLVFSANEDGTQSNVTKILFVN
jgi:hypothetical protein